mgnify:CR=1 FL=1
MILSIIVPVYNVKDYLQSCVHSIQNQTYYINRTTGEGYWGLEVQELEKISGLSKAGSVALWGIFALGKTTKQWHCNNCKSDF